MRDTPDASGVKSAPRRTYPGELGEADVDGRAQPGAQVGRARQDVAEVLVPLELVALAPHLRLHLHMRGAFKEQRKLEPN